MRKLIRSFKYALCGLFDAILKERNFRIHMVAMATVIYFSSVFGTEKWEAVCLAIIIALVMAAELFNTAVEAVVDICSPEHNVLAKVAKDSAAAAVLVFAVAAVVVAVLVFSERDGWLRVSDYVRSDYGWLIAFAALGTGFIFLKTKDKEKV